MSELFIQTSRQTAIMLSGQWILQLHTLDSTTVFFVIQTKLAMLALKSYTEIAKKIIKNVTPTSTCQVN